METNEELVADVVCQMETFAKTLSVKVVGYSLIKLAKPEKSLVVATFDLAGHRWAISFSPFCLYNRHLSQSVNVGSSVQSCCSYDYHMTLHISLLTETKCSMGLEVEFSLLDHKTQRYSVAGIKNAKASVSVSKHRVDVTILQFMLRSDFEKSKFCYLEDDCFMLNCSVRLIKPFCVETRKKKVDVPASNFSPNQRFIQLWESGERADVAFKVNEEIITAHRDVLVARSPVFRAQFLSPMIESKTNGIIEVEDMTPKVFKLILHFIYTDNLPPQQELSIELAQHLLVAADRYGVERLKLICEEKLSATLTVETAATTLVLAEQHDCEQLKEMCIDFVASRENLQAVMATDGFSHLMESCPLILKELLNKLDVERKN